MKVTDEMDGRKPRKREFTPDEIAAINHALAWITEDTSERSEESQRIIVAMLAEAEPEDAP